jgi:hypothetical protein
MYDVGCFLKGKGMDKPLALTPDQAFNALYGITARLSALVAVCLTWLVHLTVLYLLLLALWATGQSPESLMNALRSITPGWLVAAGVSGLTVAALYWKLLRWAHVRMRGGWMTEFLMRGLKGG